MFADATFRRFLALELGSEPATIVLRDALEARDIFGAPFVAPAAPKNRALMRLSVNCALDPERLDRVVAACRDVRDAVRMADWPSTRRKRRPA